MAGMDGESISNDLARETAQLRRIARGIVLEPALAEDAVQEAWLAALRAGPRALTSGGWLTEAVRRIAHGLRRREARQARREHVAAREEQQPSAAETAARVELLRELLDALDALDEPYRSAVQMRLVDDLPPREIAARSGVPVETARTWIKRGVARLRERLDAKHAHDRGQFLALLAPLAGFDPLGGAAIAALAHKTVGGTLMGVQMKFGIAAAIVLAAGVALWRPWTGAVDRQPQVDLAATPESSVEARTAKTTSDSNATALPSEEARAVVAERESATSTADAWTVRGRVVSTDGVRLSGVDVRIALLDGYEGESEAREQTVRSDEAGEFELAFERPLGGSRIRTNTPRGPHFALVSERLLLRGAPAPQDLVVTCYPLDITLRGRVLDAERRPIAKASVAALGDPVDTDDEGRFEAFASSEFGEARVSAWREGFAQNHVVVQLRGETPRVEDVEIVLGPGGVLRGRVVDAAGRRIIGAELRAFPATRASTTSDSSGAFELRDLPLGLEWLSIGVTAPGHARKRLSFQQGQLPAEPLEIVLERGVTVSGTVSDSVGAPTPGAKIGFGSSQFDVDALTTVAGDDGVFALRDCPPKNAKLWAEAPGFASHLEALDLRERRGAASIAIRLERGVSLRGIVVDRSGAPLDGVLVSLLSRDEYLNSRASTSADGRFELQNAPERGDLQIECYGEGLLRTTVEVPAASGDLRIEMERAAGLYGRVIDAERGEPITRFRVRFVSTTAAPGFLSGVSTSWFDPGVEFVDENGEWSTTGESLPPGEATGVEITAAGHAPARAERVVATVDPRAAPVVLELSAPAKLLGVVLDANTGAPVPKAVVRCAPNSDVQPVGPPLDPKRAYSSKEGAFELHDLARESTWVVVEAPGYAPLVAGPFEPSAAGTRCVLEVARGATLRGVLRDVDGRPVADAKVLVSSYEPRTGESRGRQLETDADGRFSVSDLAPGSHQVARILQREPYGVVDISRLVEIDSAGEYEVELRPSGVARLIGNVGAVGGSFEGTFRAERLDANDKPTNESRAGFVVAGRFEVEGLARGRWRVEVNEFGGFDVMRSGTTIVEVGDEPTLSAQIEARSR